MELETEAYHRFVIEGKALHLPESIAGGGDILENDPSLAFVFQCLEC